MSGLKKWLFFILIVLLVVLVAHPLLIKWAAGAAAKGFGVRWEDWDTVGYSEYRIEGIHWKNERLSVAADTLILRQPLAWLWVLWRDSAAVVVNLSDWTVQISTGPDAPESEERRKVTPVEVFAEIIDWRNKLANWIPVAQARDGTLLIEREELRFDSITWTAGQIQANGDLPREMGQWELDLVDDNGHLIASNNPWWPESVELHWMMPVMRNGSAVINATLTTEGINGSGTIAWNKHWIPAEVDLDFPMIHLPHYRLGEIGIGPTQGNIAVLWKNEQWGLDLGLTGMTEFDERKEEGVVTLQASGNLAGDFVLQQLEVSWPFLKAHLNNSLSGSLATWEFSDDARFEIEAMLDKLISTQWAGSVTGFVEVDLDAGRERRPEAVFALDIENLVTPWLGVQHATISGDAGLGWVRLQGVEAFFNQGSRFAGAITVNYQNRVVEYANWDVRWVAADFSQFIQNEKLLSLEGSARVTASGPWNAIQHNGAIRTDRFEWTENEPIHVAAVWKGDALDRIDLSTTVHHSVLFAGVEASVARESFDWTVVATEYFIQAVAGPALRNTETARIEVSLPPQETPSIKLLGFSLADENGEHAVKADLNLPGMLLESLHVAADRVSTRIFRPFTTTPLPEVWIESLDLQLNSDAFKDIAAIEGLLNFNATYRIDENSELEMLVDLNLESGVLRINHLDTLFQGATFLDGAGHMPLIVERRGSDYLPYFDPNAPLSVRFDVRSYPLLLDWVEQLSGYRLEAPTGLIDIKGSLNAPQGMVRLAAARVDTGYAILGESIFLDELFLDAEVTPEKLTLHELTGFVRDERFVVAGGLPMQAGRWEKIFVERELPDWRLASGSIALDSIRLETIAAFFPDVLGRSGTVSAHLSIEPDTGVIGEVIVNDMQTRPLPLGYSVERINGALRLRGQSAELIGLTGFVSGQPFEVTGTVDFPGWQDVLFDFTVTGDRLPFLRNENLLLRGDLDLKLTKRSQQPPHISGTIEFSDSLFVREMNWFAAGGRSEAPLRPPYFSIQEPPWSLWTVNVHLRGREFLRIQSPFLVGRLSADFRLRGPLRDPLLYGSAFIDQGNILFNFGTLRIQRAVARIALENPYAIELDVFARGRSFGHDISLLVDGLESDPRIQFTSSTGLNQRSILQLLIAGILPEQDGGGTQSGGRYALLLGRSLWQQFNPGGGGSFSERLRIESAGETSESGRDVYEVEFELDERWSVLGEYDKFDDFNLGLKWNVLSR